MFIIGQLIAIFALVCGILVCLILLAESLAESLGWFDKYYDERKLNRVQKETEADLARTAKDDEFFKKIEEYRNAL